MNRLHTYFLFLCTGLLGIACKSELNYSETSYTRLPQERVVPYHLAAPQKLKGRLLVIIPDDPDTNRVYYSHIAQTLEKKAFDVMLIGKTGEDNYKKRSLDAREERIEDVVSLVSASDSLFSKELILLGCGQGAYLLPALQNRLKARAVICINAGVLSPLAELEYMVSSDSLSKANQILLNIYGIDEMEMLQSKIDNIKNEAFGSMQLAPSSNRCWQSYYNNPLLSQLSSFDVPVLWYSYRSYPLLSLPGMALSEKILAAYPEIQYSVLKKAGKNQEQIERDVLSLISKR